MKPEFSPSVCFPSFSDPVITEVDAKKAALQEALAQAEAWCAERRIRFGAAEKSHARAVFEASETFLGPISAPALAGWMKRHLLIEVRDPKNPVLPLVLNPVQYSVLAQFCDAWDRLLPVRFVILKARQHGISTLIQAILWFLLLRFPRYKVCTMAHVGEASTNIHRMQRRFLEGMKHKPDPEVMNREEIRFGLDSQSASYVDTAEAKQAKRSFTMHALHLSEVAFWPFAAATRLSIHQCVAELAGTAIFEESTANGRGGVFHDVYWAAKAHENEYDAVFIPWHWHPEYSLPLSDMKARDLMLDLDDDEKRGVERFAWTPGQIAWRRRCVADKCQGSLSKFRQEYPSTDTEAFMVTGNPVFDPGLVEARRAALDDSCLRFRGHIRYTPAVS